jgi:tetratricopeptide (TPR) repeat protein
MAVEQARPTRQSKDEEQSRGRERTQQAERDGRDRRPEATGEARGARQGEQPEAGGRAPEENGDQGGSVAAGQGLGQALQEQIGQAVQPVLGELQRQIAEAVRQQMEQALQLTREEMEGEIDEALQPLQQQVQDQVEQALQRPRLEGRPGEPSAAPPRAREQPTHHEQHQPGGHTMAVRASRRTGREDDEDTRGRWTDTDKADERDSDGDGRSQNGHMVRAPERQPPARHRVVSGEVFNPRRAIRVGLLRLARNWSDTGSIYQAIHAYTEVVIRYPQTGAAEAAVEELLVLADKLARQGRYYAALNIFNKLEQLC